MLNRMGLHSDNTHGLYLASSRFESHTVGSFRGSIQGNARLITRSDNDRFIPNHQSSSNSKLYNICTGSVGEWPVHMGMPFHRAGQGKLLLKYGYIRTRNGVVITYFTVQYRYSCRKTMRKLMYRAFLISD